MSHPVGDETPSERWWSRHTLAALEATPDAVLTVDAGGVVLGLNAAATALLGWGRGAAAGRSLADLLPVPTGETLHDDVARALAGPPKAAARVERQIVGPGGTPRALEVTIVPSDAEGTRAVTLFLRDISETRRTDRRRAVEHRLARALAAARTGQQIARPTLELLGVGLGFDHAELWLAGEPDDALRLSVAWRRRRGTAFAQAAAGLVVRSGEDIAGLALAAAETVCVDDAATLGDLPRGAALRTDGLRGCAALPLRVGRAVTGVVVLARADPEPLDAELRQTLHSTAAQLGHFAERRAAERRLADETVALAAVARVTRRLTDAVDIATAGRAICSAAVEACGAIAAFLALPDREHGGLVVRAAEPAGVEGIRFGPDALGAALRAFQTGHTAYVSDDPEAEVSSGLLQPILHDDESLGVLGVGWTTAGPAPRRSTLLLVRLLAAEAGSAISRVELVARLQAAARTDPMTGLANLRAWDEHLARELATAARSGHQVAVALLDLDGFKDINDRLGHKGGDRVLRHSAAAWQAHLRQGDVLARIGGDEFAVLLPSCSSGDAAGLVERLRTGTQQATVSIGVAFWDGRESPEELMVRADAALYTAKREGRNRSATG